MAVELYWVLLRVLVAGVEMVLERMTVEETYTRRTTMERVTVKPLQPRLL